MGEIQHAHTARPPPLPLAGVGALVVNLTCAFMLARCRVGGGSLTRAAFRSVRNDALANVAVIGTELITAYSLSAWPDLIVGLGIAILNADAALESGQLLAQNSARSIPLFHKW